MIIVFIALHVIISWILTWTYTWTEKATLFVPIVCTIVPFAINPSRISQWCMVRPHADLNGNHQERKCIMRSVSDVRNATPLSPGQSTQTQARESIASIVTMNAWHEVVVTTKKRNGEQRNEKNVKQEGNVRNYHQITSTETRIYLLHPLNLPRISLRHRYTSPFYMRWS